jgi:ribosome-associated protein
MLVLRSIVLRSRQRCLSSSNACDQLWRKDNAATADKEEDEYESDVSDDDEDDEEEEYSDDDSSSDDSDWEDIVIDEETLKELMKGAPNADGKMEIPLTDMPEWIKDDESEIGGFLGQRDGGVPQVESREHLEALVDAQEKRTAEKLATVMEVLADERGAEDVCVVRIAEKCNFAYYMVCVTAPSKRQTVMLAELVFHAIKASHSVPQRGAGEDIGWIEGASDDNGWTVVDSHDMIIHFMLPELRAKYDIDRLWAFENDVQERQILKDMNLAPEDLADVDFTDRRLLK